MAKKNARVFSFLLCLLFLLGVGAWQILNEDEENIVRQGPYKVDRVVDGDTIIVDISGQRTRIRMIGIDTPESVAPQDWRNTKEGKEASEFTKSLIEGKKVYIEFDVEERDKYGRLLAYVYMGEEMINEILLEKGYAKLDTVPPNVKYVERFQEAFDRGNEGG